MRKQTENAQTLDQLRGYEGKAAAYYFEALRTLIPNDWGFQRREYHPPPDPANALLSLVYTLLRKDIEVAIRIVGLDPYLGFFHALGYNRPALALDLMEEFRPVIADIVVLALIGSKHITLEDFTVTGNSNAPIRMTEAAMLTVIAAYEERLLDEIYHPLAGGRTSYRRVFELQARQMARVISGEELDYNPIQLQ